MSGEHDHLSELGLIHGLTSSQAVEEARRNLAQNVSRAVSQFESVIQHAVDVVPEPSQEEVGTSRGRAQPKDLPVLVAAVRAGAHWLVTFSTKDYYDPVGIRVLTVGQALQAIRSALFNATGAE